MGRRTLWARAFRDRPQPIYGRLASPTPFVMGAGALLRGGRPQAQHSRTNQAARSRHLRVGLAPLPQTLRAPAALGKGTQPATACATQDTGGRGLEHERVGCDPSHSRAPARLSQTSLLLRQARYRQDRGNRCAGARGSPLEALTRSTVGRATLGLPLWARPLRKPLWACHRP